MYTVLFMMKFFSLRILANIAPDILCHTLKIAPTRVASGFKAKLVAANVTAKPLFCIPTSIANAVVLSYLNFSSFPAHNPNSNLRYYVYQQQQVLVSPEI